ncbi:hypothetical protein MUO32_04360 [Shinella sp. CPCC 101442]|uniref:hypothetical protein n=1 Tax=Shinella sp. CPCC 101442 TaxID=2932265 RepID=UPI0021534C58|nr:hypothetical protein [Shinella sp. CPCC 101442]MCR6498261.1 hypothetical protein [Shinella sp. CPCC 101442]
MATTTTSLSKDDIRWPGLAASPTFAVMALISVFDTPPVAICGTGTDLSPISSMTAMYLLMALFHLAPWLKLARRPD